ncbi:MAG: DUF2520 domain-containing protein [Bacteroidia bacterium]|nr:DUF2520 domain-containing protein [Bacteroidia bacterium]
MIKKVVVIGAGRLAWSLIPNLQKIGIEVSQLISRDKKSLDQYQEAFQIPFTTTNLADLETEADLCFIAVSDGGIATVAENLSLLDLNKNPIFVHSSGSTALASLKRLGKRIGVFYPLQIFTQSAVTPFQETPIFIEGEGEVGEELMELADKMSPRTYYQNSEERLKMHMGAVIACNFTNYLYLLAQHQLPADSDLNLSIYAPLIRSTVEKALESGPENTQTGPAIRGDQDVIRQHLNLLQDQPEIQKLYLELSKMINPELES